MDEERIDLSPLDIGRDPLRHERMVASVLARAGAARPHPLAGELVARGRRVALAGLAVAVLAWIPALAGWTAPASGPSPSAVRADATAAAAGNATPLATLTGWAEAGAIPAEADVYAVLGVNHGR